MANLYDKNSIESLEPREFIRLRPGVYAGDTTYSTQLLIEALANAVDEYKLGHCRDINITIDRDTVSFEDDGQGFIVGEMREDEKSILEASFSVLNTSGKFRENGVYEGNSLGSYGIGNKLICFLSEWLEVLTIRDNKYEKIRFEDGLFKKRELGECGELSPYKDRHGTVVTWKPDQQFFTHTEVEIEKIKEQLQTTACLCPSLTIKLTETNVISTAFGDPNEIVRTTVYKSKNGIHDLVDAAVGNKEIIKNRLEVSFTEGKAKLDLVMTYTSAYSSTIVSYVNNGLTESGPHITQIKTVITREFNQFIKKKGWLKEKEENLSGDDIQEGIYLVFNITAVNVGYDAQVKSRVTKIDTSVQYREFIDRLREWLERNEKDAKIIAEKAINARKARTAAKKAREAIREAAPKEKKTPLKISSKLSDAWSKDRKKCEIYIVEGDSAGGGAKTAKDNEFQAVLPVRGKIINVLKQPLDKLMAPAELRDMINAFGLILDVKNGKVTVDESKLRYGKIIISADADIDGAHICILFYTFIWTFAPELIEKGYIYATIPPLYKVTIDKKYVYVRDDAALEEFRNTHKGKKYVVNRLKGLGEMDSDELKLCLFNHETRLLKQITVNDAKMTSKLFEDLMGTAVQPRKDYIEAHGAEAEVDF